MKTDTNLINLNNILNKNISARIEYMIRRLDPNSGKLEEKSIIMALDENNFSEIKDTINHENTAMVAEIFTLSKGIWEYTFALYVSIKTGHAEINVTRYSRVASKDDEVLLESTNIDGLFNNGNKYKLYINKLSDIFDNEDQNFVFESCFNDRIFIFKDYSEAPYRYDGEGYISINNGDKYPLLVIDKDPNGSIKNLLDTKNNVNYLRSKIEFGEVYSGLMDIFGIIPDLTYVLKEDIISYSIYRSNEKESICIAVYPNEKYYIDYWEDIQSNREPIRMLETDKPGFELTKIDDNKYHAIADFDWIPDIMEIRDGYGHTIILEKYKRLKLIK